MPFQSMLLSHLGQPKGELSRESKPQVTEFSMVKTPALSQEGEGQTLCCWWWSGAQCFLPNRGGQASGALSTPVTAPSLSSR
jgi:hypothetical protein